MPFRMNILGDEFCEIVIFISFRSNLFNIQELQAKISALPLPQTYCSINIFYFHKRYHDKGLVNTDSPI